MTNAAILLNDAYSIRDNLPTDLQYLVQDLRFEVSRQMTRCAGKAWNRKDLIQLSLAFFSRQDNYENHFRNTVLHELAHILAVRHAGIRVKPHGLEWKQMAIRIGARPVRCHSMELAEGFAARRRAIGGTVSCCKCKRPIELGPTQYNRHLKRIAWYEIHKQQNPEFVIPTDVGYRHTKCPVIRSEATYEDLA